MSNYLRGDVVLVRYPFTDLSRAKVRPALVISTSHPSVDIGNREIRVRHYQNYFERGYPEDYLRSYLPFVWSEAKRQGLS
jgi:hypothetical protein